MLLSRNFQFSQACLQDFLDCPHRFYLRYVQQLAWPGVVTEPVLEAERYMQQGQFFHTLVYQRLLGLPKDMLDRMVQDADLDIWWANVQPVLDQVKEKSAEFYPETFLKAELGGFNLVAKCDLVMVEKSGRVTIYDWKTSQNKAKRASLLMRPQTRVYPYLLARAGAHLNNSQTVRPEHIEMVYWFARFPDQPERFPYSQAQYQSDEEYLRELITGIAKMEKKDFKQGDDPQKSRTCQYRTLCGREERAGNLNDLEADHEPSTKEELNFDFEQIIEVEF